MASVYQKLFAECIGTAALVFVGCGSCITFDEKNPPTATSIGMTFGLVIAAMANVTGRFSGCHINPAVTLGLLLVQRITIDLAGLYVLAQLVGSVVGAFLLKLVTPSKVEGGLGITLPNQEMSFLQAVFVEAFITFILVIVVIELTDPANLPLAPEVLPLSIGLTVTACHLAFIPFTGASMNPARSFGIAFVTKTWQSHSVYWVGPLTGGAAAAGIWHLILS